MTYKHGWFQLAFEYELENDITAASVGDLRLIIVRDPDEGIRVYDANCPHRGAHLGLGGRLDDSSIICPFHGHRIYLGESDKRFCIKEYKSLSIGGMVFVRLSDSHDNGFPELMQELVETHTIVHGFIMPANAATQLVTENGFDSAHFMSVHGVLKTRKFEVGLNEQGALVVSSEFNTLDMKKRSVWSEYSARTISPGIIVVTLGSAPPYKVITGTIPVNEKQSTIRLSLLFPNDVYGDSPDPRFTDSLVKYSRMALEDDHVMWANMAPNYTPKWLAVDAPILKYHNYCQTFK